MHRRWGSYGLQGTFEWSTKAKALSAADMVLARGQGPIPGYEDLVEEEYWQEEGVRRWCSRDCVQSRGGVRGTKIESTVVEVGFLSQFGC